MKSQSIRKQLTIIMVAFTFAASCVFAESRSERKARERAESEAPTKVAGGPTFTLELAYGDAFAAIVRSLQKADYSIETANKDAGAIITTLTVTGGYRQTGTRAQVTVIDEGSGKTTVKVAVTTQKRYNGLQTEAWSDAKLDAEQSQKLAALLQSAAVAK